MEGPLWPPPDEATTNRFLQMARNAFGNKNTISNTFLSTDNPVTLTRKALEQDIGGKDYYVAHKADGTRFVLCLDFFRNVLMAAFVNRAGRVFMTHVRARKDLFYRGCVFDGEFCIADNVAHYLVFNVLQYKGTLVRDYCYTDRLTIVRDNFAAGPRPTGSERQPSWQIDSVLPNFTFWVKPTVPTTLIHQLPPPQFPCDGFVFTPANESVRTGRNEHLFKWKANHTVDVGFEMVFDSACEGFRLNTWFDDDVTGEHVSIRPDFDISLSSVIDAANGFLIAQKMCPSLTWKGIFECSCVVSSHPPHILHVKHTRPDKFTANTPVTVHRTVQTIRENVSVEEIKHVCQQKTQKLLSKVLQNI